MKRAGFPRKRRMFSPQPSALSHVGVAKQAEKIETLRPSRVPTITQFGSGLVSLGEIRRFTRAPHVFDVDKSRRIQPTVAIRDPTAYWASTTPSSSVAPIPIVVLLPQGIHLEDVRWQSPGHLPPSFPSISSHPTVPTPFTHALTSLHLIRFTLTFFLTVPTDKPSGAGDDPAPTTPFKFGSAGRNAGARLTVTLCLCIVPIPEKYDSRSERKRWTSPHHAPLIFHPCATIPKGLNDVSNRAHLLIKSQCDGWYHRPRTVLSLFWPARRGQGAVAPGHISMKVGLVILLERRSEIPQAGNEKVTGLLSFVFLGLFSWMLCGFYTFALARRRTFPNIGGPDASRVWGGCTACGVYLHALFTTCDVPGKQREPFSRMFLHPLRPKKKTVPVTDILPHQNVRGMWFSVCCDEQAQRRRR
nr:hypothetical protein CFP56_56000 [Quercus suber]